MKIHKISNKKGDGGMESYEVLEEEANRVRRDIIEMLYQAGSGHPGGSLSITDTLVSLYNRILVNPEAPDWEERDRVILSKGHAAPALYAVLGEHGFFSPNEFKRLRKLGGILQGHPDKKKIPGVDACSGSLGLGVSTACGIALAGKQGKKDYRVYVILGDGEMQEGIVWESALFAAHYRLDNMIWIIDRNGLQIDGRTEDVMGVGDLGEKMQAFGFSVVSADGHDFKELDQALYAEAESGRPRCVVLHTVKGKGISFMENQAGWHGKALSDEDYKIAMLELKGGT